MSSPKLNALWSKALAALRIRAVVVLLTTGVAWLFLFGVLKHFLWRDPHSGFFEDATVYDLGYSAVRRDEARDYVKTHDQDSRDPVLLSGRTPTICAAMVTYKRPHRQYLNESIGSLLVGLTADERQAVNVRLLFAHSDPSIHPDWNSTWLRVVDSWSGYELSESELNVVRTVEEEQNFYVKGVIDYTYVLEQCINQTDAPYIAILEDDIIFAEGWLSKTIAALNDLKPHSLHWLYLRLFYTETSLGWNTDSDFWYRNTLLFYFVAMVISTAILFCARWRYSEARTRLDVATVCVLILIATPAFATFFFMVGKYNLFPLKGVESMDKFGCCTQALVFPRSAAADLLDELRGREGGGQTDALIEEYADRTGYERFALAPQVVQHVGLISSRNNLEINTQSTWAFWFEAQKAKKLHLQHSRLAAEIDWRSLPG